MSTEDVYQAILELSPSERAKLFARLQENQPLWDEMHQVRDALDCPDDMHYLIVFDGGSRGNPGPAYGSYAILRCDTGQRRIERIDFSEAMTSNEAEYRTLIGALRSLIERIRAHGKDPHHYRVEIRGDSRLVVNQLRGVWKAHSPRMRALRDEARALLSQFGMFRVVHHPREESVRILGH